MIRGIGLRGAVSLNVITMIGIGPLVTIPLVLSQLGGPLALAGWIAGALVALCDGLVWAELSSRYPGSGGTYVYLLEIFGRERWGRFLAFLFNWQFLLYAPFVLASGYIGFANYLGYLVPAVATHWGAHVAVAVAVGVMTVAALYRRVSAVAAIGTWFAAAAVGTLLVVIAAAFWHGSMHQAFALSGPVSVGTGFFAGLGGALYIALYDYVGYSDAALLGDEVRAPRRTVPLSILIAIILVAVLYVALQIGVLGAVRWQSLVGNAPSALFVASTIVEHSWGTAAARIVTILILLTAFASVYGNLAGFARIPYAAAKDGVFLPVFARLHPRGQFPDVALGVIGAASLAACFFSLDLVIAILTAGIVLIQSVAQIAALFVMRARGDRAPFRMWLYPLPALVALTGWLYAFAYTGPLAITFGIAWLCTGAILYLFTARRQRTWPFAAAALCTIALCFFPAIARASVWPGSAVVQQRGYPVYTVDGKPFFVDGAAFFYERIPRSQWASSLDRYRLLGINTIDLYVPWNWHEIAPGVFDFTGRTNPRRDLVGLLRTIAAKGFKVILRPGPVIRNEWRNGGYPAWLLQQPAYHMPLRDVLAGRYPATATLQNAHSDEAANEWLHNATHLHFAARWLQTVLRTVAPWRSRVIAIALDDDQGAYIDNQTWPAPHFVRYLRYLAGVVQAVVGPRVPLFINTYQMKVTPYAPVWAWGNWYQSDAYAIGEHDRAQLEFTAGLLQTQPHRPVMISEFQAGWLQGADEAQPRPADPTNTTLALGTLLQMGMHGVVNFPVQDTLNPAGWEAPWANAFYSWDAALSLQLSSQARWKPTQRFGAEIRAYGTLLARTHPVADAAIAYATSAYHAAHTTNAQIALIAQATQEAQRGCRTVRITCAVIDLRYVPRAQLRRYAALIVPPNGIKRPYIPSVRATLRWYVRHGGRIVRSPVLVRTKHPAAGGIPNAVLLALPSGRPAFLEIVNYASVPLQTPYGTIAARDTRLVPLLGRRAVAAAQQPAALESAEPLLLRPGAFVAASFRSNSHGAAAAYRADVYHDGFPAVVLQNARVRLVVSPCAGARAFVFTDRANGDNLFTTVGGLRDAWLYRRKPSPRDYIAAYTHPIAAGTFNRCYSVRIADAGRTAQAVLRYTAPDAPPHGARFQHRLMMRGSTDGFDESLRVRFAKSASQRAQQISSVAVTAQTQVLRSRRGYAFFDPVKRRVFVIAWNSGVIERTLLRRTHGALLTLTIGPAGEADIRYRVRAAATAAQAQAVLESVAYTAGRGSGGTVDAAASKAAGQNSCGFKSHLPHQFHEEKHPE